MQTVRATARCQYCEWKARATGDNVVEVGTFLRRLCLEHTEAQHAEEYNNYHHGAKAPQRTQEDR